MDAEWHGNTTAAPPPPPGNMTWNMTWEERCQCHFCSEYADDEMMDDCGEVCTSVLCDAQHLEKNVGHYIVMCTFVIVIGILIHVARRLDPETHRASHLSGCQAVIEMASEWQWERRGLRRILGRAARLHSLSRLFMPPPRLLRYRQDSAMLIGILFMTLADMNALLKGPEPPPDAPPCYAPGGFLPCDVFATFVKWGGGSFVFWCCQGPLIAGGTSTCERKKGWVLSAFLFVFLCAWWTWSILSGVNALRSELAFFADFLADVAVYWFIWEPLLVLNISTSMQFCACCKRCGRGKEPPRAPEPGPSGRELTVVAQPLGTGSV